MPLAAWYNTVILSQAAGLPLPRGIKSVEVGWCGLNVNIFYDKQK
jgi:hypothetical protein